MSAARPSAEPAPDPRRWFTLLIAIAAMFITSLDGTMLSVAIPTIARDFGTGVSSVYWVITGYTLVFATLLIVGGRLGDVFGHRRVFMIGTGLYGIGSLIGSVSGTVGGLVAGQAVIKGIGAALMVPCSLAIVSRTFQGVERAKAFGIWGATSGAAGALGPVVGGFLTTNYSWRWALRINILIAPIVIVGALLFIRDGSKLGRKTPIDALGALLVAVGMFGLVFGLSQSGAYGWWEPLQPFTLGDSVVWPVSRGVSFIPLVITVSLTVLLVFRAVERRKERRDESPLFEFGQLRHPGFRYGLLVTLLLTVGQFGVVFVVPVFLQSAKHLSAETTGVWLLPMGIAIVFGAQLGVRWTRRIGIAAVVRLGLLIEAAGVLALALTVSPTVHIAAIMGGLTLFGLGLGAANAQVTNVVLIDVDAEKSGVASGAATAVRQAGNALSIAVIGSLLTSLTISHFVELVNDAERLPIALRDRSIAAVRQLGSSFVAPRGATSANAQLLDDALTSSEASATRYALFAAAAILVIAALVALKLPRHDPSADAPVVLQEDDIGLSLPTELTPTTPAV